MLTILEHSSTSYGPRTYANGAKGDVTIAIATDYSTAGEKLTHKAAGDRYLKLPISEDNIVLSRLLYRRLDKLGKKLPTINVAGNGIYTLSKSGITQAYINDLVFEVVSLVHHYYPIAAIVSGGQTGVDLAGGVAGVALGIPTTLLLPKGFKQRHEDKIDREFSEDEIREQVMLGVSALKSI